MCGEINGFHITIEAYDYFPLYESRIVRPDSAINCAMHVNVSFKNLVKLNTLHLFLRFEFFREIEAKKV